MADSVVIGAVVVDHDAGPLLRGCVDSLLEDGADRVVVVENGSPGSVDSALGRVRRRQAAGTASCRAPGPEPGLRSRREPRAGRAVRRPRARVGSRGQRGSRRASGRADGLACGARGESGVGDRRSSDLHRDGRRVPLGAHVPVLHRCRRATRLFAQFNPENPFTRRYNPGTPEGEVVTPAGWVSGSCFLARRNALEEFGGFDEAYFMYLEDTDLCWRAHQAGWGVGFAGTAAVTHVQGVSTARHPYKMMVAHHRSALRFTVRTTKGWRRAALPLRRRRARGADGDRHRPPRPRR